MELDFSNGEAKGDSIFARLRRGTEDFSSMQRVVCAAILENYQKVAFITVEELAALCGASPATVVRTVKMLEYGSYREMQEEFEKMMVGTRLPLWWELERSLEHHDDDFPLPWVAKDNADALLNCVTPQLMADYGRAVDMLCRARRIYIVGMRSSQAAAIFFHSMLKQILPNVACAGGGEALYDDLVDLGQEDVLFCISLGGPHYAKATANALGFAAQNAVPTLLVTNSPAAPAAEHASLALYVPSTSKHYSLVTCITLLESLVISIGQKNKGAAQKKLRKLERILVDENVTF